MLRAFYVSQVCSFWHIDSLQLAYQVLLRRLLVHLLHGFVSFEVNLSHVSEAECVLVFLRRRLQLILELTSQRFIRRQDVRFLAVLVDG